MSQSDIINSRQIQWFPGHMTKTLRLMEKEIRKVHIIDFDEDWFSGKSVVTFDDVITRGITWATYADQLENLGAHVIGGIFLAKTHYKVNRQ